LKIEEKRYVNLMSLSIFYNLALSKIKQATRTLASFMTEGILFHCSLTADQLQLSRVLCARPKQIVLTHRPLSNTVVRYINATE
jgi:hypothetical protein